ncbi:alpha/beta fold hydrolase [Enterococcus saccharolyticus]|uniref:alpha/beta fold hydrolase n=1 Tax=Enterococcus saccharolyticus TaxID=41997 RepID=UPI001E5CC766|nr:alpha/beta fold hydrolase [Enterococcus saccharolyticus]MCD5001877.1 alpha/beta fold hydrolase [Enterococcus saccharolyticus]
MKKIFFLLLFILVGCGHKAETTTTISETTTSSTAEIIKKSSIPTLFIHGYSGGPQTFGTLIERMEKNDFATKEMTITVKNDGNIQAVGQLSGQANNPMIQVLFEDNESHEWNQAEWIRATLAYLHDTYAIKNVYLVGHSMGGASSLRYLGTYGADDSLPQVNKFSAIGAPFNEFIDTSQTQSIDELLANGPTEFSARYNDYATMLPTAPKCEIQLLAGQLSAEEANDGMVPVSSALAVYHLLQENNYHVSSHIIKTNAQHSQLHENEEVDALLQAFLWDK